MQDGFLGKTLVLMKILVKINDIYGNQSETGLLSTHSGLPQRNQEALGTTIKLGSLLELN